MNSVKPETLMNMEN